MSDFNKHKSISYFECEHKGPTVLDLKYAEAVIFSSRSPVKETANEDALAVIPVTETSTVLVVADGLGGMPNGEIASRLVIEELNQSIKRAAQGESHIRAAILDGIEQANLKLLVRKIGAATTIAIAEIQNNTLRSYHAGDSLIMLTGSKGKIKTQTVSHSPIGYALESGLINEAEAMRHEERHLISNFIGTPDLRVEIGPNIKLAPRDTLLLSSDGVSDNLYDNETIEIIRKGPLLPAAETLVERCQKNMLHPLDDRYCHPDDLSFILFRLKRQ